MSIEQEFVKRFENDFKKIKLIHKNVKKNPDVSFLGTIKGEQHFFALEVKVYNKHNSSNYPKELLSEILINRQEFFCGKYSNTTGFPISFGILLSFNQQKTDGIYKFLTKHILCDDWMAFGKRYSCKYVFLYDSTGKQLYYQDWDTFLNGLNPLKY